MDFISYRGIPMEIIQSLPWEKEVLYDQSGSTTYECTRVRGNLIVAYNPGAVSYFSKTDSINVPRPTPGFMPATTELSIRKFLEQPRGQLIVRSGDVEWLRSPANGVVCDVRNGPFVKVNSVGQIQGERLWKIHLEFETYINETPTPALIISNRWYAYDTTNWQHLRTRVYQGTCTVRGDMLQAQTEAGAKYIDYFRSQFCGFTLPNGFQREEVKVTVTPDGNTAHYTVVDTEQLFNKSRNSPAVRIEIADTNWTSLNTTNNLVVQAAAIVQPFANWLGAQLNRIPFLANNAPPDIPTIAAAVLSKIYKNVLVRCWGNQTRDRRELVRFALTAALNRMGTAAFFDTSTSELIVSQDTNNFVQVNYTINWGPDAVQGFLGSLAGAGALIASEVVLGGALTAGQRAFANSVTQNPDTSVDGIEVSQKWNIVNPIFPGTTPNSFNVRGTSATHGTSQLYYLVTQALEGFNESPAAPTALPAT